MIALLLSACTPPGEGKDDTAVPDDGQPHIVVVSPEDGATVGDCLTMEVAVRNFTLVDPADEPTPVDGHGHWHVVFPERYFVCETTTCDVDIGSQATGDVELDVQLFANDYTEIVNDDGDPVTDTVVVDHADTPCE